MQPNEVARQVELMARAGLGGAFIHARIGLLTPYLGEQWFAACAATLKACRDNGLIAWLYDEDKWPSGFSGGSVPLADPDFRHKALIARSSASPAPPDCTPVGSAQGGVQVYRWVSPLGDAWFNGTTYADLLSRVAMRLFLDDAYEPYFERFSEDYGSLIVAQFTDEPCSSYRPRIPKGAIPFSDELPARFEQMHGYAPVPMLPLLFGSGEGAERFRLHYYQTVAELFELNYSAQLGQWCEEHGIALTGHYILEGNLYDQKLWGTQIMPHYRHQGIPGIDHLGRQISERITGKQCASVANQYGKKRVLSELYGVAGGGLSFEDRWWIGTQQITLGVNLLNPHLALYTMAGCRKRDYPQNLFYQQPWWPLNSAVDEPLSRLCLALSQGKYNAEMLVLHPQQSTFVLWEATQGDGVETLGSDWHPVTQDAQNAVQALDTDFQALTNTLLGAQCTFDFGDETLMRDDGRIEQTASGPRFCIGEMSYPMVLLPSLETMSASTFELLREFMSLGGPVLRCGRAPRLLDGERSAELASWLESIPFVELEELATALHPIHGPLVEVEDLAPEDARLLWTHIRELEGGERLVWLVNLNRDFQVRLTLRGDWANAQLLDARTGDVSALNGSFNGEGVGLTLPFARTQGHLIHLFPNSDSAQPFSQTLADAPVLDAFTNGHYENGATSRVQELPAELWRVERLDDNALTLDCARWKARDDWSKRAMPVIAIQEMLNRIRYAGPLALRFAVRVGEFDRANKVHLVIERPENFRVSVNGTPVEASGLPFWRDIRWIPLDISGLLRAGNNEILLECDDFRFGDLGEIHDQVARYGTEIESVYLVGDFGVACRVNGQEPRPANWDALDLPADVAVRCIDADSIQLVNSQSLVAGDVVPQGLPFYAGRLQFSATLPRVTGAKEVVLKMEHLDGAVAQVGLNGEVIGTLWAHPLELALPASASEGDTLSITIFGTLRNLLGPHHHIAGELVQVGPHEFGPTPAPDADAQGAGYASWLGRWMNGEAAPLDWAERYCLLALGETGAISLLPRP